MNEELQQSLGKLLDSNGKVIVTDDMPDDLKAAINYLNDNNINILSPSDSLADADEEEENDDDFEEFDSDFESSEIDENLIEIEDEEIEDESTIQDLNDIF